MYLAKYIRLFPDFICLGRVGKRLSGSSVNRIGKPLPPISGQNLNFSPQNTVFLKCKNENLDMVKFLHCILISNNFKYLKHLLSHKKYFIYLLAAISWGNLNFSPKNTVFLKSNNADCMYSRRGYNCFIEFFFFKNQFSAFIDLPWRSLHPYL